MAETPQQPNEYQGKQAIINSDRILFNSKEDSILLFAYKHISLSCNGNIHFDTSDGNDSQFVVNSPLIHLGLEGNEGSPTEHVVLGDAMERIIGDICDAIDDLGTVIESQIILVNSGGPTSPGAPGACSNIRMQLMDIKSNINQIKSARVKVPSDNMYGA